MSDSNDTTDEERALLKHYATYAPDRRDRAMFEAMLAESAPESEARVMDKLEPLEPRHDNRAKTALRDIANVLHDYGDVYALELVREIMARYTATNTEATP